MRLWRFLPGQGRGFVLLHSGKGEGTDTETNDLYPMPQGEDLPAEVVPTVLLESGESLAALLPGHAWPPKPWLTIWTAPRSTIRAILNADPKRYVLALAALSGILNSLNQASSRSWAIACRFGRSFCWR